MKQVLVSLYGELASTACRLGDWPKAIKNLEYYLKETSSPERTCIPCYELGLAYACNGDNENAMKYFNLALERHRKDAVFELYAARKSQEYVQKGGPTTFDKVIFEARQRMSVNLPEEVIKLLGEKLPEKDITNPEEKAVYEFVLGACYHKLHDSEKAFKYLVAAYKEKAKVETWVQPHSLVEMAELEYEGKNIDQAHKALDAAQEFKNYNFQAEVSQRTKRLTDILNGVEYNKV